MATESNADWHKVAGADAFDTLDSSDNRIHTSINGRYISVLKHQDKLHCLDSVCFHAGGPIALGDIEELSNTACLICPWHYYRVSLETGEKWYQSAEPGQDGKYHAGQWKSIGKRQRIHNVEQRPDGIYVQLNLEGTLASDEYACKQECGHRVKSGASRLTSLALEKDGRSSPSRGSSSPRSASPARTSSTSGMESSRGSPRASRLMEGEDVWPQDLEDVVSPRRRYRSRSPSLQRKSPLSFGAHTSNAALQFKPVDEKKESSPNK